MKTFPVPRVRTNGALTPSTVSWNWWNTKDSIPTPLSNTYAGRKGFVETMTDVVTPNFSKRVANGEVINSLMTKSSEYVVGGDAGWKFQNTVDPTKTYYGECFGDWCLSAYGKPYDPGQDSALLEHLVSLAATAAWAAVEKPAVNGMAMLGEMHQTLNMLGDPVRSLTQFLWKRAWADGDYQQARGRAQKSIALANLVSSSWLQYQYAWRPILMDIEEILKELQTQTFTPRKTARGRETRTVDSTKKYVGAKAGINIDFTEVVNTKYDVRATIYYETKVTPSKRFGLTWTDLPDAAWELTPWSFVVDWFINVGDYIRAITPKPEVNILSACTSIERVTNVTRSSGRTWLSDPQWTTVRRPGAVDKGLYRNKRRYPSVDLPSLTVELDPFNALRSNRGVNAFMLFLQQFIKR